MPDREIITDCRPLMLPDGKVLSPTCCGAKMLDDGDCGQGCCDDYRCPTCGRKVRVEWPD